MAEPGPEPGRAWRLLALCGAAVFLAAAAAGGALVAWNLAASTARGPRCPEPEQVNATLWPPDSAPEVEELRRRLAEAEQLHESLAAQLQRAKGDKRELEVAFKACKDRQKPWLAGRPRPWSPGNSWKPPCSAWAPQRQPEKLALAARRRLRSAYQFWPGRQGGTVHPADTVRMGLAMDRSPYSRTGDAARGCWYYLRYFFLFVSLIQFLIILGLVLFMIYGNVHVTTEASLKATEIRADNLYSQVMGLSASQANLTKQLNISTHAKEAVMQLLLSARRELERINASFRQCQSDLITYINYHRFMVAIILSEKQCWEQVKENNKTCEALLFKLGEKAKTLEMEVAKEKAVCAKDKESLLAGKRQSEEQLAACDKARERQQQEQQVAEEQLRKVQALCLPLDQDKFQADALSAWRDSLTYRSLDNLGFHFPAMVPEITAIRRTCEHMPLVMSSKVEEMARGLRMGIERVTRENAELRRQKLEVERGAQGTQEARTRAEAEAQARESQLRAECARQTQLALEEKAALRAQRDGLARDLEARKRELEQLRTEVDVRISALDACLKAKSQPALPPRISSGPAPPPPIDPATLEEFKKRILESQRPPLVNPAVPPR
ncbi:plasmalemma vesicle-associated protein [Cricetulus griseus]|uniref:Plasmalemma vesicle-associated protein n=1 Tax=Cricetulus griseus TaxID=10029 RepID=A0A061IJG0_CRIGR|nr:plasmalemma vesicle-associated protein [Cricetulus griseus]